MRDYLIEVVDAHYIDGYRIRLTFTDGKTRTVNLESILTGKVFSQLKDIRKSRQFRVDKTLGTIVWPNGADLAPYSLYEMSTAS
jgi:hypothetical protein